ncbi:MAG: helix-turn-helix domain-containing protein [Betaproteobacteria bacterium]|jgi:AcrR family transcriptional regulator
MPATKVAPSFGPSPPDRGVKASTFRLLLDTAMELIREAGHVPSMADVAQRSGVSRATVYRYFPSRSALIAAVMDASLGPVRDFSSPHADGPRRVRDVFEKTFPLFQAFEPQMRAAVQLSLEQWAQERAGTLEEEPYRRGHRVRILGSAIAPLSAVLEPAAQMRLHQALTVVYGIETYMVLKDIWGLSDRAVEKVALWMADTLVAGAMAEGAGNAPTATRKARRPTPATPSATPSAKAPT